MRLIPTLGRAVVSFRKMPYYLPPSLAPLFLSRFSEIVSLSLPQNILTRLRTYFELEDIPTAEFDSWLSAVFPPRGQVSAEEVPTWIIFRWIVRLV